MAEAVVVLLYVHRNRRLIRDGSQGRPHLDFHTAPELCMVDVSVLRFTGCNREPMWPSGKALGW